ncbi:hypothetical protein LPB03_01615 [Polaribacter vadi]|uniref:DUF5362 domain-containing protein n=1 Tax=Polaribacter vadi TaxID=1774273 RepID=A0A1B8U0Q3_9FLAO|nr:DUF5362 family protein [Polaribacter vadi]AOW16233.1 hypothetical protein LPB03_01615 [Polaribacter vadi]OBY65440.1 hypothetical protein LPB3_03495 [Polaribacter vadi]|tara:strand:- start:293 stop:742 length:450 start_codon:yes stop_codon:yes gene_type:complete
MQSPITQLEQLVVNSKSKSFLREIARWTFFFSILGFISIALTLIAAILIATVYAPMLNMVSQQQGLPAIGLPLAITYVVSALLYFMPVWYLFKFSRKMKSALATKNDDVLADAFENLKSHFKYIGVLTIIVISLYVLLIVFSLVAGSLV